MNLKIDGYEFIGRNDHWQFAVARVGDCYLGVAIEGQTARAVRAAFAAEGLPTTPGYMHVFGQVSEGVELGMTDKRRAMLLVGALAQDPEQGFGGVDEWLVPEDLRGKPDDFRCNKCLEVGCDGRDCEEIGYDEDFYEDEGGHE